MSTCCLCPRSSQPSPSRSAVATTVPGSQRPPSCSASACQLARGHARQEPVRLSLGADLAHDGDELGQRRQEHAGRGGPSQLLDDDGQLDEAAPEAAQVDVHRECRPAEPCQPVGEVVAAPAPVGDVAHQLGRALACQCRPGAVAQLELLVGELEIHAVPLSHRASPPGRRRHWIGSWHPERYAAGACDARMSPSRRTPWSRRRRRGTRG